MTFTRDPEHWLFKLDAEEWLRAAMGELRRAEESYAKKNGRAGLAGARRAAGMALNGVLVVMPGDAPSSSSWGRSYMDHLLALRTDAFAPARVQMAAKLLVDTPLPGGELVALRTGNADHRVLEATRDILAYALALVRRGSG